MTLVFDLMTLTLSGADFLMTIRKKREVATTVHESLLQYDEKTTFRKVLAVV